MEVYIKMFQGGGFFMYPIAIMLIAGSIIIAERLYMVMIRYNIDSGNFMQKIQGLILDNNIEEAIKLCNSRPDATIAQIFKAALLNADQPVEDIQDHMEVATLKVIPKLQNRVPYLSTIANVSTLLGLLGTIIGLVQTFEAVGAVNASEKQALLSAGISKAMSTTAFGLVVAIPCTLVYGYLYNKINSIVDEVEHYSARLLVLLRTGSDYFDRFTSGPIISTEQTPQVKDKEDKKDKDTKDKKK